MYIAFGKQSRIYASWRNIPANYCRHQQPLSFSSQEMQYKASNGHKPVSSCKDMKHSPLRVAKDLCRKGVYSPLGSSRACEGTSADESLGKSRSWLVGQMFSCHTGLFEALDLKWSCSFQKLEVTTVCTSAHFCCCHCSKTKLILNALSLGITQIPQTTFIPWLVMSVQFYC